MSLKLVITALGFIPALVFAQNTPNMIGTWKGVSNSAVYGSGMFHPTEAGKEKAVRFRNIEFVFVIDKEEGRNFVGSAVAIDNKHLTDAKHKELILGAYAKDMKSGVMVSELGYMTFKVADSKNLDVCYTKTASKPMVASCFELVKQ